MRTIKGDEITKCGNNNSYYGTYTINNREYWVQGEFSYNKAKKRFEHIHIGKHGGEYLVYWKYEF